MQTENPTQAPGEEFVSPLAHLRPCTAMEMLDRTAAVLCKRWKLLVPLGLLYALPESLTLAGIVAAVEQTGQPSLSDRLAPLFMVAWLVSQGPGAALILATINGYIFADRPIGLWMSLRHALPRLPHLILTRLYIMFTLVLLMLPAATLIMPSETAADTSVPMLLLALGGLVAAALLGIFSILAPPVVMVESRFFFRAIGRSIHLMRTTFRRGLPGDRPALRFLLLLVIPGLLYAGTQVVVNGLSYQIAGTLVFGLDYHPTVWLASAVLMLPARLIAGLWLCAGVSLLYLECRMRTEGFDLFGRLQIRSQSESGVPDWADRRA